MRTKSTFADEIGVKEVDVETRRTLVMGVLSVVAGSASALELPPRGDSEQRLLYLRLEADLLEEDAPPEVFLTSDVATLHYPVPPGHGIVIPIEDNVLSLNFPAIQVSADLYWGYL